LCVQYKVADEAQTVTPRTAGRCKQSCKTEKDRSCTRFWLADTIS